MESAHDRGACNDGRRREEAVCSLPAMPDFDFPSSNPFASRSSSCRLLRALLDSLMHVTNIFAVTEVGLWRSLSRSAQREVARRRSFLDSQSGSLGQASYHSTSSLIFPNAFFFSRPHSESFSHRMHAFFRFAAALPSSGYNCAADPQRTTSSTLPPAKNDAFSA